MRQRVFVYCMLLLLAISGVSEARPSRKTCLLFAKEIETVMRHGDKALVSMSPQAVRDQNRRVSDLKAKADSNFVQANACYFAANSASALWSIKLQEHINPTATGSVWIQRRQEDYRDNLDLCKQGFEMPH